MLVTAAIVVATGLLESGRSHGRVTHANTPERSGANSSTSLADGTADLSAGQLNSIKIEPVGSYLFPVEKETGGSISFVDDLSVQVFPSYQGKIIKSLVRICPARAVAWRKAIGEHATTYLPAVSMVRFLVHVCARFRISVVARIRHAGADWAPGRARDRGCSQDC
jgi:hypothetical protein